MQPLFTIDNSYHFQCPIRMSWQTRQCNLLATSIAMGSNSTSVLIFNRKGELVKEIPIPSTCLHLDWHSEGNILAILMDRSSFLYLWDVHIKKLTNLDINFKDYLTWCGWSRISSFLGIGTSKGSLIIYNYKQSKRIPIIGKHSKRITCGAWNIQNLIALGSDDKTISLSNVDGDELRRVSLRTEPSNLRMSNIKRVSGKTFYETSVSAILGKKSVFLWDTVEDNESNNQQVELAFQKTYGDIIDYSWFGDGYICLAFSNGFTVVVSTHSAEIGRETMQSKPHKNSMFSFSTTQKLGKAASIGISPQQIVIMDLSDVREIKRFFPIDEIKYKLETVIWTEDGQLVSASTSDGTVFTYLVNIPVLGESYLTRIVYLTSIMEVTTCDLITFDNFPFKVSVPIEPTILAAGVDLLAVGMNNRVWFYFYKDNNHWEELCIKDYLSTIKSIHLNSSYAAIFYDGKILLQLLIDYENIDECRHTRIFPPPEIESTISCCTITQEFLLYGTSQGIISYFLLDEWDYIAEIRHNAGIRLISPDPSGTRLIFLDEKGDGFVYCPISESLIIIPCLEFGTIGALWDQCLLEPGIFITFSVNKIQTYLYLKDSIRGPKCDLIECTTLTDGYRPLLLYSDQIWTLTSYGKLVSFYLSSHTLSIISPNDKLDSFSSDIFNINLKLYRLRLCWDIYQNRKDKTLLKSIGIKAQFLLDVDLALRCYRILDDPAMIFFLDKLIHIEERNLIAANMLLYIGEINTAHDLFLTSSKPIYALEMRRDLLNWDKALFLAKSISPNLINYLSIEYAHQLEFQGDYLKALENFKLALTTSNSEFDLICLAGIAKNSIRVGEYLKGISFANNHPSLTVKNECANILNEMTLFTEAAHLYEQANEYEKAANLYARLKQWNKVYQFLPHINSKKVHSQYAKASEVTGFFREAIKSYKISGDFDSIVRIQLDHMNNPDEAIRVVGQSQSVKGAEIVARYFQKHRKFSEAVKFLVMSKCIKESFALALKHNKVKIFADTIGDLASIEDNIRIANYFEEQNEYFLAGKFFLKCKDYPRSLNNFLQTSSDSIQNDRIQFAIQCVSMSNNKHLIERLISYLMGEEDGEPKDARFLFRLYIELKQYREAAKTAAIIAREDQIVGKYKNAHSMLFKMSMELHSREINIPNEMRQSLMLLHSYILAKFHLKRKDHSLASRLLLRVSGNISKFPEHIVSILTVTALECQKANLKASGFKYAAMLLRPEYRSEIAYNKKKEIENIVRRSDKTEERENVSSCPFCSYLLPENHLDCSQCKNTIPYCIITGRHMLFNDWAQCPYCQFPALYSIFSPFTNEENSSCPMCMELLQSFSIVKVDDPTHLLKI